MRGLRGEEPLPRFARRIRMALRRDKVSDRALKAVIAALDGLAET